MPRAIDLAGIAIDAFCVRKVAGRRVEPKGFGIQRAAGCVEYVEQGHVLSFCAATGR